jgi:glutamate--cysteine ligase
MRQGVRTLGLRTPIPGGRSMQDLAKEVMAISRAGLRDRGRISAAGDDESGFLSSLDEIAASGLTPAERLLQRYHGPWNRDLTKVFAEEAY